MSLQSQTQPPHVIVSGGSRGLGAALVRALLGAGYRVSTFSRRETDFTNQLAGTERFYFHTANAANQESLSQFVKAAVARFGTPYGLVNCAGIAVDGVLAMMPVNKID